jgi:hypothetical protein
VALARWQVRQDNFARFSSDVAPRLPGIAAYLRLDLFCANEERARWFSQRLLI